MSPDFRVTNTCFLTVYAFRLNAPTKTTFCVGNSRLSTPFSFSSLYNCSNKIDASHPVSKRQNTDAILQETSLEGSFLNSVR